MAGRQRRRSAGPALSAEGRRNLAIREKRCLIAAKVSPIWASGNSTAVWRAIISIPSATSRDHDQDRDRHPSRRDRPPEDDQQKHGERGSVDNGAALSQPRRGGMTNRHRRASRTCHCGREHHDQADDDRRLGDIAQHPGPDRPCRLRRRLDRGGRGERVDDRMSREVASDQHDRSGDHEVDARDEQRVPASCPRAGR